MSAGIPVLSVKVVGQSRCSSHVMFRGNTRGFRTSQNRGGITTGELLYAAMTESLCNICVF